MKNKLFLFFLFFALSLNSQKVTYEQVQEGLYSGPFTEYTSKDGGHYRIGDKLHILTPSSPNGMYLTIQKVDIAGNITMVGNEVINTHAEIKKMRVIGNKRSGYKMQFQTKGWTGLDNYFIYIEDAISVGEVKSTGISSKDALEELKRAADKLNLGLITQEEYEVIKKELTPFIR
jgi:hypothetical protein